MQQCPRAGGPRHWKWPLLFRLGWYSRWWSFRSWWAIRQWYHVQNRWCAFKWGCHGYSRTERGRLHLYCVKRLLGAFSHGAREYTDDIAASVARALVCDDVAVVVGALMEIRVEVGGEWFGEVQRPDFALELVCRVGDREVVLEFAPVDDPVYVWDWLIPPPLHGWFSRSCSWLSRRRCRKCRRCRRRCRRYRKCLLSCCIRAECGQDLLQLVEVAGDV